MIDLKYFTQTSILRQIGCRRLGQLLNPFATELKASNFLLPQPASEDYFADLANALTFTSRLPKSLRTALLTLENAAAPENKEQLWAAIKRRIPNVSLSQDCALDRALELWFFAPDEFSQFLAALDSCVEHGPASVEALISTSQPQPGEEPLTTNGNG